MRTATDLSKEKIYGVFDMLDVDHSGLLDFDEFYLLICILIAVRVGIAVIRVQLFGHGHCLQNLLLAGQAREAVHLSSLPVSV